MKPAATTINQGGVEMGWVAAELLLDMVEKSRTRSEVSDVLLTPRLAERGSTRPPRR